MKEEREKRKGKGGMRQSREKENKEGGIRRDGGEGRGKKGRGKALCGKNKREELQATSQRNVLIFYTINILK